MNSETLKLIEQYELGELERHKYDRLIKLLIKEVIELGVKEEKGIHN